MRYFSLVGVLCLCLCGCNSLTPPQLSLVREGTSDINDARAAMYGLYNGDTRLASVHMEDEAQDRNDNVAPLAGAQAGDVAGLEAQAKSVEAQVDVAEAQLSELIKNVNSVARQRGMPEPVCRCLDGTICIRGADGICRKADGTACSCRTENSTPLGTAPTVSPVAWPSGCVLEVWSGENCGPCNKWVGVELTKFPSGVVRLKKAEAFPDEASQKAISGYPYFICYRGDAEVYRIRGYMTAEALTQRANAPLVSVFAAAPQAPTGDRRTELLEHMRVTHRMDCTNMTTDQIEQAHNALHPMAGSVRTYYKSRGRR